VVLNKPNIFASYVFECSGRTQICKVYRN